MYKEFVISIIIIVSMLGLDRVTSNYLEESVNIVTENAASLKEEIEKEDEENIIDEKYNMLYDEWKKRYEKLAYYIEHDELEKIETSLVSAKSNIDTKQYERVIEELDKSNFLLEHLRNKDALNLKNIF